MIADPLRSLGVLTVLLVLSLQEAGAIEVHHTMIQAQFAQTYDDMGEFVVQLDEDEVFYVHSPKKEVVWRLPDFEQLTSFDAQGALEDLEVNKHNLEIDIKRSNRTAANNVPPEVKVFLEYQVELGEPNILICFMNKFFPPVINATWLKNGKPVTEGVAETDFYPNKDFSYGKFLYLSFIPHTEDVYTCAVDHWGLEQTLNKVWDAQVPTPPSEAIQTIVCALGVAVGLIGLIGLIVGIVFCIKGVKSNTEQI